MRAFSAGLLYVVFRIERVAGLVGFGADRRHGLPVYGRKRNDIGGWAFVVPAADLRRMAWTEILGQERAIEALRGALRSGRIAHAYLFHGRHGIGKRAVAVEFARALLCAEEGEESCGRCIACQKVSRAVHPDLHVYLPQPKEVDTADVTERLRRLYENPYATVDFARRPFLNDPDRVSNKQAGYHIERVHEEIYRPMSFKPVEGRHKIAIITDADLFNKESANAFLKLLEEPGDRTVFILTTERTDRVLPTIRSRCQMVRFAPLPHELLANRLMRDLEMSGEEADVIARMSDGSLGLALELAQNHDLIAMRQSVVEIFRLVWSTRLSRPSSDTDRLIDVIAQTSSYGRERVKNLLRLMLSWLRDIVVYRSTGSTVGLVNVDQTTEITKFSKALPNIDVEGLVALVENAIGLVQRNVHLTLLLTALLNEMRRAMRGERVGRLYRPLVETNDQPV